MAGVGDRTAAAVTVLSGLYTHDRFAALLARRDVRNAAAGDRKNAAAEHVCEYGGDVSAVRTECMAAGKGRDGSYTALYGSGDCYFVRR